MHQSITGFIITMIGLKHNQICGLKKDAAFTLVELMVVLAILGILAAIGVSVIVNTKKSAYAVIAQYDLQSFAKSEEAYFMENNVFLGNAGQSYRNDGGTSDFVLNDFTPSKDVVITIISGVVTNPFDPGNPYAAQSFHSQEPDIKYEYNFLTKQLIKK